MLPQLLTGRPIFSILKVVVVTKELFPVPKLAAQEKFLFLRDYRLKGTCRINQTHPPINFGTDYKIVITHGQENRRETVVLEIFLERNGLTLFRSRTAPYSFVEPRDKSKEAGVLEQKGFANTDGEEVARITSWGIKKTFKTGFLRPRRNQISTGIIADLPPNLINNLISPEIATVKITSSSR